MIGAALSEGTRKQALVNALRLGACRLQPQSGELTGCEVEHEISTEPLPIRAVGGYSARAGGSENPILPR